MTDTEFAVLHAVNIATTLYRRPGHDYEATAAQIAATLEDDPRLQPYRALVDGWPLNSRQVALHLRALAGSPTTAVKIPQSGRGNRPRKVMREPSRSLGPLVEHVDTRRWRLTRAGAQVLGA